MTDNEIIKALECCTIRDMDCKNCLNKNQGVHCIYETMKLALDLINRLINNAKKDNRIIELQDKKIAEQKSEIESLNKNYEELIYKIETLLCYSTGNKFQSIHTQYKICSVL